MEIEADRTGAGSWGAVRGAALEKPQGSRHRRERPAGRRHPGTPLFDRLFRRPNPPNRETSCRMTSPGPHPAADHRGCTSSRASRLPSQRTLSEKFGISRASLREALSGAGNAGAHRYQGPGSASSSATSRRAGPLWRFAEAASARDVYEARLALEGTPDRAGRGARWMRPSSLTLADTLVDEMAAGASAARTSSPWPWRDAALP